MILFAKHKPAILALKCLLVISLITLMSACGEDTRDFGDAGDVSSSGGGSGVCSFKGQTTLGNAQITGAWQQCEDPRELGGGIGCSVLDDDGILFNSDGTFALIEADEGGSLEAGERFCERSETGRYHYGSGNLTLTFDSGDVLCEEPFSIAGDEVAWTRGGEVVDYDKIDVSRSCGSCVSGGERRCN